MKEIVGNPLHLKSLNHISLICRSVEESIDFTKLFLGLSQLEGLDHLILMGHGYSGMESESIFCNLRSRIRCPRRLRLIPKIITFLFRSICESMGAVEKKLKEMELNYKRSMVEEGGIHVDQLFFHDPDGFMIEICDCDNLPVIPIGGSVARACSLVNLPMLQQQQQIRVTQQ
ncbi:putative glyoxalase/Bleomycin resistance protein/Dihydroxybiphenyl dioxygenase [Rosa chinensis]|uniref:Putative glyoxalase/Bleomycin resistance protein/Dihydroxybiphenyl dioxygenase n=1 Tax=Rosa chinensis TaxID=74649 RepID=A0A2P6RWB4_ROSCH|nr:putative glyoxalase/Bleomycin resistance protein/Dihydroxybiphenyl dioxygenase [Rosa chinensis]